MKIPSYDDLAPSIPDVHPRDTFAGVTRLVHEPEAPVVDVRGRLAAPAAHALFACLRATTTAAAGGVLALARDFSPRIERHGDACVVLDVSGLGRLLGDAHGIAAELRRTAGERRLGVRLAVAPTHTAACLLTLHGGDDVVVTGDVGAALASLPLAVLDGPAHATLLEVLRRWGLRTVGEFAALPADEIAARFGALGIALHRVARGIDARPLDPHPGVPRFVESLELDWPIEALEPLTFVLARLLEPLSLALERADRGAVAIRLALRLTDRTTHARLLQLPAPMRDARVLRTLLQLDLESHPPSAAIDVVTIEIDPAPGRIVQFSLLEHATPSPETVATLTARLGALVGEGRCGSPVLLDSHRPDAFAMTRFGPPVRVRAGAPGEPRRDGGVVLRRFRPPVAIRVAVDRGRPAHIAIDRKGMPGGRVERAAGPWRSSGAWWDAGDARWDRDEWDVALADGSVCRIHRDRETERWFLNGVVD
ncbi:MAG TPA: DNA polymerase Y family protein [Vicinamibacterales bacterium]|nr:DNA polymerase Y family protein [Vicinamibacterales bacterium]